MTASLRCAFDSLAQSFMPLGVAPEDVDEVAAVEREMVSVIVSP